MKRPMTKLATRARSALDFVVAHGGVRDSGLPLFAQSKWTDAELVRRAAKVMPPLSFSSLKGYVPNCGADTAREVCKALGLPSELPTERAQCPQCGHVFGGEKS